MAHPVLTKGFLQLSPEQPCYLGPGLKTIDLNHIRLVRVRMYVKMSEISAKMSKICYQIRLVYICASKLLDEALLVSHFFSMKTLAFAQHH